MSIRDDPSKPQNVKIGTITISLLYDLMRSVKIKIENDTAYDNKKAHTVREYMNYKIGNSMNEKKNKENET